MKLTCKFFHIEKLVIVLLVFLVVFFFPNVNIESLLIIINIFENF